MTVIEHRRQLSSGGRDRRGPESVARVLIACIAWSALVVTAHPTCVRAQVSGQAEQHKEEAMLHFKRGVELYEERSLDAALVEMERAHELYPSYRLLFNLAQLQAERHEYMAALELFERYLRLGGDAIDDSRRAEVEQEVARLSARVGTLWVMSNVDGARLFVDDAPAGQLPLDAPLRVDSGIHDVRLELAGHQTSRQQVRIAGGDKVRLNMLMTAEPSASPPAEPSPYAHAYEEADQSDYTPFWISVAATGALALTAVTFAVLAHDANGGLDRELQAVPVDRGALEDARSHTRTMAGLTDGFAAATLLAAGVATYFLVQPPTTDREANTVGVRLTPLGVAGAF